MAVDTNADNANAYYEKKKNEQFNYWISGIKAKKGTADYQKTYNEMQQMANDYVKQLQQKINNFKINYQIQLLNGIFVQQFGTAGTVI